MHDLLTKASERSVPDEAAPDPDTLDPAGPTELGGDTDT